MTEVQGVRVAIVNMKSGGPNAPRWQGPIPAWQVRWGGSGPHDVGSRIVYTAWTLAEAKDYVMRRLGDA